MKHVKVRFTFSTDVTEKPVIYELVHKYGIWVNILRASIDPGKQGIMVLEIGGEPEKIDEAFAYLERIGVVVTPFAQEIRHLTDRCTACTACLPHCPTQALNQDHNTYLVEFDADRCILCKSCLETCIYKAVEITGEQVQ